MSYDYGGGGYDNGGSSSPSPPHGGGYGGNSGSYGGGGGYGGEQGGKKVLFLKVRIKVFRSSWNLLNYSVVNFILFSIQEIMFVIMIMIEVNLEVMESK